MRLSVATIKDVALEAGVSISTVSAVVNKSKFVNPDTMARVEAAISKLRFVPNQFARSLINRKSMTLAYLVPDVSNVSFIKLFKMIDKIVSSFGYILILVESGVTRQSVDNALRKTMELRVDGAFVVMNWAIKERAEVISDMVRRGIHVVGVGGAYELDGLDCFLWDEEGAGVTLGRYLKRIGHSKVICVGPADSAAAARRWKGLQLGLLGEEARHDNELLIANTGGYASADAYAAVLQSLATGRHFTAMVGFNDAITTGALAALHDQGLIVGDDVSVVSFGEHHRDFSRPRITSMIFDDQKMGTRAAERLLGKVRGDAILSTRVRDYIPMNISIQSSSRKPQLPLNSGHIGAKETSENS
jgi:LacI family transcriptional regulator